MCPKFGHPVSIQFYITAGIWNTCLWVVLEKWKNSINNNENYLERL